MLLLLPTLAAANVVLAPSDLQQWQVCNGSYIQVIEFPGIHSFSRADVLTVMATEKPTWLRRYLPIGHRTIFYADQFAADLYRVEHFYAREGFPHAVIRGYVTPRPKRNEVKLKVEIVEGPPVLLQSWKVELVGNSGVRPDSAHWSTLMPIKIGKRLALSDVQASADSLRDQLYEMAYARARVTYEIHSDSATNTAAVTFTLDPGHYCWIGQTRIIGLKQIEEPAARRELTYHELEPYSPDKLDDTRRRLVNLQTFTLVSVRADTTTPGDTLNILIQVEEGTRYRIRFGGGYDTQNGAGGSVEFRDLNFLGRARRLTWTNNYSKNEKLYEMRFLWPHTPFNATDITLNPKYDRIHQTGFDFESYSGATILSATPLKKVTVAVSNESGRARLIPGKDFDKAQYDTTRFKTYTRTVETFSAVWDTRDNPLVAHKGHAIGVSGSESGALYGAHFRWWRANFAGRVFVPATRYIVLAGRAAAGMMAPTYGQPSTPIEERFFLGGSGDVRGWPQRTLAPHDTSGKIAVGGDASFNASAEIRYNVMGPLNIALFVDAGNVWPKTHGVRPLDLYSTAGVGLLILSPVGPVRIDWAYQLRRNPYRLPLGAFAFSLGSPF
jgi:outer membrane protein insertion porin family